MSRKFKAACVQVNAGNNLDANVRAAADIARQARRAGADFITMPECVSMMEDRRDQALAKAMAEPEHRALAAFRELAREIEAWLLAGSLSVKLGPQTLANRSYLIDPKGAVAARYDKIHMFDVDLPGGDRRRESATYKSGEAAVVADTPFARLGLTVCYDVRFPQLYRALAKAGAEVLTVPAAFTRVTGRAHWHVLMRARAIETGSFVVAAAQCGDHPGKRQTYGHSLIVDPWGEVLADCGEEPGFVVAEIELARVAKARAAIPALAHDRPFGAPEAAKGRDAAE